MKRFATIACAVTIATSASSALAQFPSSANETTSFASEFPNIVTYADLHRNDFVRQASSRFPSSVNETTSFASEFPQITTYADLKNEEDTRRASLGETHPSM